MLHPRLCSASPTGDSRRRELTRHQNVVERSRMEFLQSLRSTERDEIFVLFISFFPPTRLPGSTCHPPFQRLLMFSRSFSLFAHGSHCKFPSPPPPRRQGEFPFTRLDAIEFRSTNKRDARRRFKPAARRIIVARDEN